MKYIKNHLLISIILIVGLSSYFVYSWYQLGDYISLNSSNASDRVINSIVPSSSAPNDVIEIRGVNLDQTVQAFDKDGARDTTKFENEINDEKTIVKYKIPDYFSGGYLVRVGPNLSDTSNMVSVTVSAGAIMPTPTQSNSGTAVPRPTETAVPRPTETAVPRIGAGLAGEYYTWTPKFNLFKSASSFLKNLSKGNITNPFDYLRINRFIKRELTPKIQLDWAFGGPGGVRDYFLGRWFGSIRAPVTGEYTFYLDSDDGANLAVDGHEIIVNKKAGMTTGTYNLESGKYYKIAILYFEGEGLARINLSWSAPSLPKQVIPTQYLYPTF